MSEAIIMIGGAGGIGSHLAFQLARTGASLYLFDFDTVEETNMAGQLFGKPDIGKTKVEAVSCVIDRLCGENKVTTFNEKVEEGKGSWRLAVDSSDIVCAVFDNIKARKLLYDAWKAHVKANPKRPTLFVDGRMAAENGQVFIVSNGSSDHQFKKYEENFFDDSEVEEQPCSAKATTHCGSMISAIIVAQISNWLNNISPENAPRSNPDAMEFHLPVMLFRNKYIPVSEEPSSESRVLSPVAVTETESVLVEETVQL